MNLRRTLHISVALLTLSYDSAHSQAQFRLGEELPRMAFRVCWSFSAARSQAHLSALQGQELHFRDEPRFSASNCEYREAIILPMALETTIEPFVAWAPKYDPRGDDKSVARWDGKTHEIAFTIAKQRVAIYRAKVSTDAGVRSGWIELSDEPYVLTYCRVTRQQWRACSNVY